MEKHLIHDFKSHPHCHPAVRRAEGAKLEFATGRKGEQRGRIGVGKHECAERWDLGNKQGKIM